MTNGRRPGGMGRTGNGRQRGNGNGRRRRKGRRGGPLGLLPQPQLLERIRTLRTKAQEMTDRIFGITRQLLHVEPATGPRLPAAQPPVPPPAQGPRAPAATAARSPAPAARSPGAPTATVDEERCLCCGVCVMTCPEQAISLLEALTIDPDRCNGCGTCVEVCPTEAISLGPPEKGPKSVMEVSMISHATDETFETVVVNSDLPVLVDFWAPRCPPCRVLAPTVEKLAKEFDGRARVVKVNVDEAQRTAMLLGIMSIPTIIVFCNGRPIERLVGLRSREVLSEMLERSVVEGC
jgi:thioredoxin 1